MRWVLIILGALLGLLLAAALGLFFFFPVERVRTELERAVEVATGRALSIEGPVQVMIYPVLGLEAQQVRLANLEGGQAPHLLAAESVAVGVELLPLLGGEVRVKRLELIGPKLALEVDGEGRPNWLLLPPPAPDAAQPEIKALSLADVRIEGGALSFASLKDAARYEVSELDLVASMTSLEAPLTLAGSFTYGGERAEADLTFAAPRAFLEQGQTPLQLSLRAGPATGALKGVLDTKTGAITGEADLSGESFRRLAAWLGAPLGPGPGFGPFTAAGQLEMAGGDIRLKGATLSLDALRGKGEVGLSAAGPRPKLTANLALGALDLNAYLAPTAAATPEGAVNVQTGWSEAPFDFAGLRAFDADLQLRTGALTFQKMRMDKAAMRMTLNQGVLDARLSELGLYGGTGAGRLIVDASAGVPRISQSLRFDGVQALPFLTDAIGMDRLAGAAKLELDLAGAGRNQKQLMQALDGTASLVFTDGEIKGVSLGEVARTVRAALSGQAVGAAASTDFARFAVNATVRDGVAACREITLVAPFLRMSGEGLINLGEQTVDLRVAPRAVAAASGQGGALEAAGIGIPFRITGPWSKLKYAPDLGGAAQRLLQQQLDRVAGQGGVQGLLGAVFGAPQPAQPETPPDPNRPPAKTRSLLEELLGGAAKP